MTHAGGRPTKYDPSFCERVIEMGKHGKSKAYMAAELGVPRSCFDDYEKDYPEFSEAVNIAVGFSQRWWEAELQKAATGENPDANSTLFIFNMKNRFKAEWSDKTVVDNNVTMNLTDFK